MAFLDRLISRALLGPKARQTPQPGQRWKEVGSGDPFAPAPSEVVVLDVKDDFVQFTAGRHENADSESVDVFTRLYEPVS